MNELALFAGAGGGILAGKSLGWRTVCAVELDPYCASVLMQRQNDGLLPPFPIWDDVCTFDGRPWKGIVDVVSGGFPCQDISAAGKGEGITGERSGLWVEMARIIGEVRPRYAFVENSPMLTSRGLGMVLGDLAAMGYDARWGVLGAAHVGAPHLRERIWIRAEHCDANSDRKPVGTVNDGTAKFQGDMANASGGRCGKQREGEIQQQRRAKTKCASEAAPYTTKQRPQESMFQRIKTGGCDASDCSQWKVEPDVGRVAHGVAYRVDRIKSLGNGQVPQCAAEAWRILSAETAPTSRQTR